MTDRIPSKRLDELAEAWYLAKRFGGTVDKSRFEAVKLALANDLQSPPPALQEETPSLYDKFMADPTAMAEWLAATPMPQNVDMGDILEPATEDAMPTDLEAVQTKALNRVDSLTTDRCDKAVGDAQFRVAHAIMKFRAHIAGLRDHTAQLEQQLAQSRTELVQWKEAKFSLEGIPTDGQGNPQ